MRNEEIMPVLFVATNAVSAFTIFIPNAFSIDYFNSDPDDIRRGMLMGATWSLALTLMVAKMTKSAVPITVWALVTAGMAAVYEMRLRIWNPTKSN